MKHDHVANEEAPARRSSRRKLLAGAAGAAGILAAEAIANAAPASAADGDVVKAGQSVTATHLTKVTNTADTGAGLWGIANGETRHGIYGTNTGGGHGAGGMASVAYAAGVHGMNLSKNGYGVFGESKSGVSVIGLDTGDGVGVYGESANIGVQGFGDLGSTAGVSGYSESSAGVIGQSADGVGVSGVVVGAGVGVRADSAGIARATALQVKGPAEFSRSGLTTIPRGSK
jgi:hypothetical protein